MLALHKAIGNVVHDVLAHLDEVRRSSAPGFKRLRRVRSLERRIQDFLRSVESNVDRLIGLGQSDLARALNVALEPVRECVLTIRWVGLEIAGSIPMGGTQGFGYGPPTGAYPVQWESWKAGSDSRLDSGPSMTTLPWRRRPHQMGALPRVEPEGLS